MDGATSLPGKGSREDTFLTGGEKRWYRNTRLLVAITLWGICLMTLLVASVIVHFHPGPWPFDLQTTVTLQSLHLWAWVNSSIDFISRLNDPLPVTIPLDISPIADLCRVEYSRRGLFTCEGGLTLDD